MQESFGNTWVPETLDQRVQGSSPARTPYALRPVIVGATFEGERTKASGRSFMNLVGMHRRPRPEELSTGSICAMHHHVCYGGQQQTDYAQYEYFRF